MSVPIKNTKTAKRKTVSKPRKVASTDRSPYITVSDTVGNYEKHPFFVKKANEMKELIKRVGRPVFSTEAK